MNNELELREGYYNDLVSITRQRIDDGNPWWLHGWFKRVLVGGCFVTDFAAILTLLDGVFLENYFLLALMVVTTVIILNITGMITARSLKRLYYGQDGVWPVVLSVACFVILFALLASIRLSSMDLGTAAVPSGSDAAAASIDDLAAFDAITLSPGQTITTTLLLLTLPMLTTIFCGVIAWLTEDPLLETITDLETRRLRLQELMSHLEGREQELMSDDPYYEQQNLDKSEYAAYMQARSNERQQLMIRARELLVQHLRANPSELTSVADSSRMIIY